jgi:hypothetical protein
VTKRPSRSRITAVLPGEPRAEVEPRKRVRASQHALTKTIKAMQDCGLTIARVSINGGRIEIHCTPGSDREEVDEYEGLGKW